MHNFVEIAQSIGVTIDQLELSWIVDKPYRAIGRTSKNRLGAPYMVAIFTTDQVKATWRRS